MKSKIKQIGFSVAALSIVSTSSYALFGVGDVVHDPIQTAKAVAEYAEQAKRWTSTVQNYRNELLAKTGVRDVMSFQREMSDLMDFMDHYSLDFMDLSNDIVDRPRSQVGQYAKHLFDQYNLFDDCQYDYLSDDQKRICKNQMVRNVQEIATYQHTTQKLKSISSKLSELARKRERSDDIKESEDISNAIQMQIAQLQIIKTQVDLMEAQNRSKARVDERQAEQLWKESQNKTFNF